MELSCSVLITDRDGWHKRLPLDQALIHIGSDARNHIVLETQRGSGVAPRHLQLVAISAPGQGYRAVNLSTNDIALGGSLTGSLAPRSALEISDGVQFQVGEFSLLFSLGEPCADIEPVPAAAAPVRAVAAQVEEETSRAIGLRLSLPGQTLSPDRPLEGTVTVHNRGREPGVQFRLELEGLEPDYYEMGPGPILFPNVEKAIVLRLNHPRGPALPAGKHTIRVSATAPDAYPGERAVVSREIEVLPYYSHALRLVAVD